MRFTYCSLPDFVHVFLNCITSLPLGPFLWVALFHLFPQHLLYLFFFNGSSRVILKLLSVHIVDWIINVKMNSTERVLCNPHPSHAPTADGRMGRLPILCQPCCHVLLMVANRLRWCHAVGWIEHAHVGTAVFHHTKYTQELLWVGVITLRPIVLDCAWFFFSSHRPS